MKLHMEFKRVQGTNEFQTEGEPGCTVYDCVAECIKFLNTRNIQANEHVVMNFNGIPLYIYPHSEVSDITDYYCKEITRKGEEYRQTPEYKEQVKEAEIRLKTAQDNIDTFMNSFKDMNQHSFMIALKGFTDSADNSGVNLDYTQLLSTLLAKGYIENDFVGKKDELNNSTNMARYVIGQVMNCAAHKMPPHPICIKFVEDYERQWMKEHNEIRSKFD